MLEPKSEAEDSASGKREKEIMKVNGVMLREAISLWEMRRDASAKRFPTAFYAKDAEVLSKKWESPSVFMDEFMVAEANIAKLQAVQARYNLDTTVSFMSGGETHKLSLCEAVKRQGGLNRAANMWKEQTKEIEDKYDSHRMAYGDKNGEYPARRMTHREVVDSTAKMVSLTAALRGAIAVGNTREMEFDIAPSLFE